MPRPAYRRSANADEGVNPFLLSSFPFLSSMSITLRRTGTDVPKEFSTPVPVLKLECHGFMPIPRTELVQRCLNTQAIRSNPFLILLVAFSFVMLASQILFAILC